MNKPTGRLRGCVDGVRRDRWRESVLGFSMELQEPVVLMIRVQSSN